MQLQDIERLAENYALSSYLTKWGSHGYDDLMDAFSKNVLPDDVVIWQPFDGYSLNSLITFIEVLRNDYLDFAERISHA